MISDRHRKENFIISKTYSLQTPLVSYGASDDETNNKMNA
jgi:hypothetical protein